MPLYGFATYTSVREQWAVSADSLEDARKRIGDDAGTAGWLSEAVYQGANPVDAREFVQGDNAATLVKEIAASDWAWREAKREPIERSLSRTSPPSPAIFTRTVS
jgi:hypothetical protein